MTRKFWLRLVLELLYLLPAITAIHDQKSLPLVHERNHHDFVFLGVWKLQRILGCLDIVSQNLHFGDTPLPGCGLHPSHHLPLNFDLKPFSRSQAEVDANSGVKRDIEFTDGCDAVGDFSNFGVSEGSIGEIIFLVLPSPLPVDDTLDWGFGSS